MPQEFYTDGTPSRTVIDEDDAPLNARITVVLVGGNHAALLIGADHPPYDAAHDTALEHYAGRQDAYEAWCCWQTIMMARDVLGDE